MSHALAAAVRHRLQPLLRRGSTLSTPAAKAPTFLVSEIFRSVQGEGPHAGRPSIFLRLGKCNLSCVWCDTPYTWLYTDDILSKVRTRAEQAGMEPPARTYDRRRELKRRTIDQVYDSVVSSASPAVRAVVVTGGEPLLHAKPLVHLVPKLQAQGFEIEFETNGTVSPGGLPRNVHLNVSPKLSNSLIPAPTRFNFRALEECMSFPSSILKFVVEGERDAEEVVKVVSMLCVEPERVFLMPQGTDSETLRERGQWLVDLCVQSGFNYCHRIHVSLWGDERGV